MCFSVPIFVLVLGTKRQKVLYMTCLGILAGIPTGILIQPFCFFSDKTTSCVVMLGMHLVSAGYAIYNNNRLATLTCDLMAIECYMERLRVGADTTWIPAGVTVPEK